MKVKSLSRVRLCNPMDCMQSPRLLHPWDFPGKNPGVGCHFLLQEIFPTQRLNPGLPRCRQTLYRLSHQGSPLHESFSNLSNDLEGGNEKHLGCSSRPATGGRCTSVRLPWRSLSVILQNLDFAPFGEVPRREILAESLIFKISPWVSLGDG